MDLLIERSREIRERADPDNKAKVETEVNSVSADWAKLISGLEARRDVLTKLAHHWEVSTPLFLFPYSVYSNSLIYQSHQT